MHLTFSCIFLFLAYFGNVEGVYKRWMKDTNWDNPLNWNAGTSPCGNDRVIVPDDSPIVYLQMNTTLQELTLPKNGEVIFGNNIQLAFTQVASPDCQSHDGDLEFIAVHPQSWLDPDNWCSTSTEEADCKPASPVDTENVPCVNDDVVFLRHKTYYVTLSNGLQLNVKSLKIMGTTFTTNSFSEFVNSTDGRKMFQPPSSGHVTSVTISRQTCSDIGGCACGNDQGQIQQEICAIMDKRCTRSPCNSPVTPVGACCNLCGAILNGTRGRGFSLSLFKSKLTSFLHTFRNVTSTVSITSTGYLQLVLTDGNGGTDSITLAGLIKADIDNDLKNGGHKYALAAVSLSLSLSDASGSTAAQKTGTALEGASIAGIIIGVFLLIAIVIIAFFIYKRGRPDLSKLRSWPDWQGMSRRFSHFKLPRQPSSAMSAPPINLATLHHDTGFPNPLYDTSPFDDSTAHEMDFVSPMEEQPTFDCGINNPLYGTTPGVFYTSVPETATVEVGDDGPNQSKS